MDKYNTWHKYLLIIVSFFVVFSGNLEAGVKLPSFFTSNMVLQREMPVAVWGWAKPSEKVTVSFGNQSHSTTANAKGKWSLKLDKMPASRKGCTMTVSSDQSNKPITLDNIVVGEVWICSGQSNMEWTVIRCANPQKEIAEANYPLIRHLKVNQSVTDTPQHDITAKWLICSPKTTGDFTAVGYYFARKLYKELNVPIGLINSTWGGTRIEPWIAPEGYALVSEHKELYNKIINTLPTYPKGKEAYLKAIEKTKVWLRDMEQAVNNGTPLPKRPSFPNTGTSYQSPTRIYNAMIHPLIPYSIRGVIWYQGESNGNEGITYFRKKKSLVRGWRKLWNQGDFPFYTVQLANFRKSPDNPAGGDGWAKIREAQRQALTINNTGMAITVDIGNAKDIHPKNKQDVGKRLALWALAKDYGKKLVYSGPLYKNHTVEGNSIKINFDHVGSGLMVGKKEGLSPTIEIKGGKLTHFAIAGENKVWHWATAVIKDNSVIVSSDKVTKPVAVRYAYRMNPAGCNLYNKEGLPASPFRTDSW